MVEKNVVSISFADQSKAYQAFTELKNLSAAGAISVDSAAIVVRDKDGAVSFPDGIDEVTGAGFAGCWACWAVPWVCCSAGEAVR